MEETVKQLNIFGTLKKSWKLILIISVVTGIISGVISFYILKPVYQSSTQILVNQKNSENKFDSAQLQSNVDLINTYSVIIKSPVILKEVINKLQLSQSPEELNQNITVNSKENSQVFIVTVESNDPRAAVEIANTLSEIFQQEIKGIMNVDNVSILASAELKKNPTPVSPKPLLNIAIAIVIGLMLGIGIGFLLDLIDNTLKDEQDVEKLLGMPVLGSIQMMPQAYKKGKRASQIKNIGSETIVSYGEK